MLFIGELALNLYLLKRDLIFNLKIKIFNRYTDGNREIIDNDIDV